MTDYATILIPDISGYTEFLSKTELDHSSHIINELLELLVESNRTGFTLSEIEGDALLYYRKGQAVAFDGITRQCLEMFNNFHSRIKLIERDSICQCGACQSASNLTLKFIIHYGAIKEIKVANFSKASGLDMIIAHRLLKNSIGSSEYILATDSYLDRVQKNASTAFTWQSSSEEYDAIGNLEFQYALLDKIKESIPDPTPKVEPDIVLGDESTEIDIAAPIMKVYKLLIDLDNRKEWVPGLKRGEGEIPIDRLGAKHRCIFEEGAVEVVPEKNAVNEEEIRYVESNYEVGMGLKYFVDCLLTRKKENLTRLLMKIGSERGQELPAEAAKMVWQIWRDCIVNFKVFCEGSV
jgi:uncharacterized protein YndB with AHSA1/START domain